MTERRQGQTFAKIVRSVAEQQQSASEGGTQADALVSPDGDEYGDTGRVLTPDEAQALVTGGVAVAWDSCGSGGHVAPVDWFTRREIAALIAAAPPLLRDRDRGRGQLHEWQSAEGRTLVLALYDVRWADLMYSNPGE